MSSKFDKCVDTLGLSYRVEKSDVLKLLNEPNRFTTEQIQKMLNELTKHKGFINLSSIFEDVSVTSSGSSHASSFIANTKSVNNKELGKAFSRLYKEVYVKTGFVTEEDNSAYQELLVYDYIDSYIIRPGRCPNFVKFLFGYITDQDKLPKSMKDHLDPTRTDKVAVIVMEKVQGRTLEAEIAYDFQNPSTSTKAEIRKYKEILFQLLFALRELNALGIRHNDIHFGNVFVTKTTTPQLYEPIKGQKYMMTSGYQVKVFDYDLSMFQPDVFRNKKAWPYHCLSFGKCHSTDSRFDLYTAVYYFVTMLKPYLPDLAQQVETTFVLSPKWKIKTYTDEELRSEESPFTLNGFLCSKFYHPQVGAYLCKPEMHIGNNEILSFVNALSLSKLFEDLKIPPGYNSRNKKVWKSIFAS